MFKNLIQRKLRARLLVTLHSGTHFSGVLLTHDKGEEGYSTFGDVKLHLPDKEPQSAQGELYVRNSKIEYWQSDVSL